MIEKWISLLKKDANGDKRPKWKYIVMIAILGILLMLISNLFPSEKEPDTIMPPETEGQDEGQVMEELSLTKNVGEVETSYEETLQKMLNQISGVTEAEVMVNVDSTNVHVYEKDLTTGAQVTDETDRNGGERNVEDETKETKLVYVRKGEQEVPVLVQTKKPEVRGVFVTAKGVEDPSVKKWVIEAVSRVLDVPSYRISVMPK